MFNIRNTFSKSLDSVQKVQQRHPFFSCSSSPTKKYYINSEYDRPNARMRDHSSIASPPSATSTFCFSGMIFADSTSANKNRIMHNFILFNISYSVPFIGKELTSLPLGEAVPLRTNIGSGIRQLVVSQVFCLPLVISKGFGQQRTSKDF